MAIPAIPPYIWDSNLQMRQIFTDHPGAPGHFHLVAPWAKPGQWDLGLIKHTGADPGFVHRGGGDFERRERRAK